MFVDQMNAVVGYILMRYFSNQFIDLTFGRNEIVVRVRVNCKQTSSWSR